MRIYLPLLCVKQLSLWRMRHQTKKENNTKKKKTSNTAVIMCNRVNRVKKINIKDNRMNKIWKSLG